MQVARSSRARTGRAPVVEPVAGPVLPTWRPGPDWLFPAVAVLAFALLCLTGLNGTSSGALWEFLYGGQADPRLLLGHPRGIRSDEWLVNSPMVVAQVSAGFPRINEAIGTGLDMSLIHDVPYVDWSILFRPQSWGLFVLPLDQGFAFRWWSLALVLVLAVYSVSIQLLPGRRVLAACLAGSLLLAPFSQWWWVTPTLGSLGWSAAAVACFLWLLKARTRVEVGLRAALLFWVTTCFALVLYPPFQVPCVLVAAAFCVGFLVMRWREGRTPDLPWRVAAAGGAVALAGVTALLFVLTRSDAIDAIAHTDYPGQRRVPAGGGSLVRLLYGVLTPQLQGTGAETATALPALGGNQSEASAFLLAGLFLVGVDVWLLVRARRRGLPVNAALVGLLVVAGLFLCHSFLAATNVLSRLTLLSLVPVERLQIGFGLVSAFLALVTVWELTRQEVRPSWVLTGASAAAAFLLSLEVTVRVEALSPLAAPGLAGKLVSAAVAGAVVLLLARGSAEAGVALLLTVSALASLGVNPVYQGVLDVRMTPVGQAIREIDAADPGAWVSTAGLVANAVMVESGVRTWSAVSAYPELDQWAPLDPTGQYRSAYNRYGHVVFTPDLAGAPLQNPQPDVITVDFDACGRFAQDEVAHVLAVSELASPCLRLVRTIPMPGKTFYVSDVVTPAEALGPQPVAR